MLLKFVGFILLFHCLGVCANSSFQSASSLTRYALIIGNADYQYLPTLDNPVNDANDMASTLTALGFSVDVELDASQETMEDAIANFGRKLASGGVGLFYYAGHGIQVNDINYMIPTNAELKQAKDLKYKAVNIGQLLDEMNEARNGLNIVILDACRNDTLEEFHSAGRGLAREGLAEVNAPRGTLVAFATSPGSVAADGTGKNGTYTKHLLQQLKTPGLSIEEVFKKVLQGVEAETNDKQTPWTSSSFSGDFYFIAPQGNVNLLQSQSPITVNEKTTSNLQAVWLGVGLVLLLCSGFVCYFYFYRLKLLSNFNLASDQPAYKPTSPPIQTKLTPNIATFKNAQAAGYLIDLKNNLAIARLFYQVSRWF